jgi:hypothetical protein
MNTQSIKKEQNEIIETNRIFCFNGTFTILTVFVLLMLLIFMNVETQKKINV